nr:MAG TPA: hypothetical protein [Caudoviricetes sp.]
MLSLELKFYIIIYAFLFDLVQDIVCKNITQQTYSCEEVIA